MIWSGLTFHSLQSHKWLHSKTHPWLCWSKDTVCLHLNVPPKTNIQTTFLKIPSSKSTWNFNFYWTIQRCWGFWLINSTSTTFFFLSQESRSWWNMSHWKIGCECQHPPTNLQKPSASQLRFWPEETFHRPWVNVRHPWNHLHTRTFVEHQTSQVTT